MVDSVAVLLAAAPAGSVFSLDTQTLAVIGIQLLNTGVLAAFLALILYIPVRKFMNNRTERIQSQMEKARVELAEASSIKAEYEGKLKDIDMERADIMETARRLAAEKGEQLMAEARKEAEIIRDRARLDVQREFSRAQEGLHLHIIEISTAMAERFVKQSIDEATQQKLYEETVRELEEATWLH